MGLLRAMRELIAISSRATKPAQRFGGSIIDPSMLLLPLQPI